AIHSLDCFLRLSVVFYLNECKPARPAGVAIHDDMDLHNLSVGFEQPPKLRRRHLRIQVSNKEVFHYVPLSVNCLIVGCSRAIRQEDEDARPAFFAAPFAPFMAILHTSSFFSISAYTILVLSKLGR